MDPVSKAQLSEQPRNRSLANLRPGRWVKGQSGNPGGRPKRKYITRMYQQMMADPELRKHVREAVFKEITSKGMAKVLLLREMRECIEGKITDEINLNVNISLADTIAQRRLKRVNDDDT